jgi:HD-like signal output (HDOD) protein
MSDTSINPKEIARASNQSFTMPEICLRIREMLDDGVSDLDDIADLISLDPALSSKLLKLANSPLFRFSSEIDSVSKAINIIGGEALFNLVMIETANSAFEHFSSDVIDLKRFWRQSIYTALFAKHLAKINRIRGSERFFLIGLLHNLGELMVALKHPEAAIECVKYDKTISPWKRQLSVIGFHYTWCSAAILELWNIPNQVYSPLYCVHDQNKALSNRESAVMYTSLRAGVVMSHKELYSVNDLVSPLIVKSMGLEEQDIQDAVKYAQMEAQSIVNIMNPSISLH